MFIKDGETPNPANYIKGTKVIRVTERQAFKNCRRQHKLSYIDGLEPIQQDVDARAFGTLMHSCLAAYYIALGNNNNLNMKRAESEARLAFKSVFQNIDNESELYQLGKGMLEGYFRYAEMADDKWLRIVAVEHQFTAKIPGTNVVLSGTCDLLIQDRFGFWICDHKTYRDFLTPQQIEFDDQLTAYMWILQPNGIPVRGAIYNMLRKKIPTVPQLLKNGTMSRNKSIECDEATYTKALCDADLDTSEYQDMLVHFRNQPPQFFNRVTLSRSERTVQSFAENLIHEAREMTSTTTQRYPNFTRNCNFCDYEMLCRTMRDKGDVGLAKSLFRKKSQKPVDKDE